MDEFTVREVMARLKIIRYLMSNADKRGMTHGEKHHIIQTCLGEISQAIFTLGDRSYSVVLRNENIDPVDVGEIPF